MEELDLRVQQATESLLENESLTADLDDEAAKVLIDWGLDRATEIAARTGRMNDSLAHDYLVPRLKAVRRMLRATNRWISDQSHQESKLDQLGKIFRQATVVYDRVGPEEDAFDPEGVAGQTWFSELEWRTLFTEASQISGEPAEMINALRQITEAYLVSDYDGAINDTTKEQE